MTKLVIVQPLLCSGERGIVCPAYNVPFLVAYCLLPAALCTHNVRFCEFVSVFIAENWKKNTKTDIVLWHEESVLVLGTTQEWKLLQLTVKLVFA